MTLVNSNPPGRIFQHNLQHYIRFFPFFGYDSGTTSKTPASLRGAGQGFDPALAISLVTCPSFSSFQRNHPIILSLQCYGLIFAVICILLIIFLCFVRLSTVLHFDADFFWRFAAFLLEFFAFFLLADDHHYIFIFLYLITSAFKCFSLTLS